MTIDPILTPEECHNQSHNERLGRSITNIKYYLPFILALLTSCGKDTLNIQVSSTRDFRTDYEIVEVNSSEITSRIKGNDFIITDNKGSEVPYQLTYDGRLIFPVSVDAKSKNEYKVSKGTPALPPVVTTGRFHPERQDDMAWENDKIGFRAYGPESQRRGDKLYGYDIFLKRDTSEPILDRLYALNEDPVLCARIDSLRKAGNRKEANLLDQQKSYHIDHGNGMDCYAVGPTLGAATTAILSNDTIRYPWCFETYEVLDNGPLRFTVALNYPTQLIGSTEVKEHRLITLDAGTHLNRTTLTYQGLQGSGTDRSHPLLITGIVIHDGSEQASYDAANRYIAYTDPTQGPDNGEIYIGAVFIDTPESAAIITHDGVQHVSAINSLDSTSTFTYYWGAGWDRSDIPSWQAWLNYLDTAAKKIASPLVVKVKR